MRSIPPPYPLLSSGTSLKPAVAAATRETSVVSALRAHSAGRQSGREAVSQSGQGSGVSDGVICAEDDTI